MTLDLRKNNRSFKIQKPLWAVGVVVLVGLAGFLLVDKFPNQNQNEPKTKGISNFQIPEFKLAQIPIKKLEATPVPKLARNIALIDADSRMLMYGVEENEKVPIASITKIMTAVLVLENLKLDQVVDVSSSAVYTIGSTAQLRVNEKITVESLLKALLIYSANDAAIALAEQFGKTDDFIVLMNRKAKGLGMKNTKYIDSAGLNDEARSSANDQSLLLSYALKKEKFREIIGTAETSIYSTDGLLKHDLKNSNRLVTDEMYLNGIIGGKTGFTPTSGHNLIAAAERNGHTLIVVVINTYNTALTASAEAASWLLNWGFDSFIWKMI